MSHNPELGGIIPEQIIVDWAEACLATQQGHPQLPFFPFKYDFARLGLQYLFCFFILLSSSFQVFTRKRSRFLHAMQFIPEEVDYLAILNTTIAGYISSLCRSAQ